jgi:ornithine cyclodeaminase/alanine dehydrogenase-like protein (mu-crystallin family)
MLIIEESEVCRLLSMEVCVGLMRTALRELAAGNYSQPPRSVHKLPGSDLFGFMPAHLGDAGYFGAKIVTAFHHNLEVGLPSHRGYVMLFESRHGGGEAMVDATSVTRIRTGAVSAVATQILAREDSHILALIGAGAQARSHLEALRLVRDIRSVEVFDVDTEKARAFARESEKKYSIPVNAAPTVEGAVAGADIICTLTPSAEPFLGLGMVKPGVHINAVGAFSPDKREIRSDLVAASGLYADQVEAMKRECGEYLVPAREGLIGEAHIRGSIGDLLLGRVDGRGSDDDITLFDALGLAVEDLACAMYVFEAMRLTGVSPST